MELGFRDVPSSEEPDRSSSVRLQHFTKSRRRRHCGAGGLHPASKVAKERIGGPLVGLAGIVGQATRGFPAREGTAARVGPASGASGRDPRGASDGAHGCDRAPK
jgi:hypothetical protein